MRIRRGSKSGRAPAAVRKKLRPRSARGNRAGSKLMTGITYRIGDVRIPSRKTRPSATPARKRLERGNALSSGLIAEMSGQADIAGAFCPGDRWAKEDACMT